LELNKDDAKDASKNEMVEKQEELADTFEMKSEKSQQFESKINSFNSYAQSNQLAGVTDGTIYGNQPSNNDILSNYHTKNSNFKSARFQGHQHGQPFNPMTLKQENDMLQQLLQVFG